MEHRFKFDNSRMFLNIHFKKRGRWNTTKTLTNVCALFFVFYNNYNKYKTRTEKIEERNALPWSVWPWKDIVMEKRKIRTVAALGGGHIIFKKIWKSVMYGGQQRIYCHLNAMPRELRIRDNACPASDLCTNCSNCGSGRPVGKAGNY
jgi:hypothetical protein